MTPVDDPQARAAGPAAPVPPVLVIAVRGWTTTGEPLLFGRPGGDLRPEFVAALNAELGSGHEVWAPELPLDMFSMRSPESLSRELFEKIERKVAAMPRVERIVLLGYSTGSLLTRRVFCMAHGAAEDGTLSGTRAAWADKIDRVVLVAGITRGWEFSSASPAHVRFLAPVLQKLALLVGWLKRRTSRVESKTPLLWQLKRGAPFVVATRIQYVEVFEALRARPREGAPLRAEGLPSTVFLLGARDEFISPADCTELGPRSELAFIELAGSNHSEAVRIVGDGPLAVARRKRLAAAITQDFAALQSESWTLPADDIDDYLDPMDLADAATASAAQRARVEHVVLVVHGIRDNGFWTKRVAREIKTLGRRAGIVVRAPTPTYGYFSMWDFVKPGGRDQATYWFLERYADLRSHFPQARISFVGHSNGTYIAARALELCRAVRFENVVFAGSVVRRRFGWSRFPGRVRNVLSYVGSGDGVVAFLPAVFELLRLSWLDVGGAGAFGFHEGEPPPAVARSLGPADQGVKLSEIRYVPGGHGAAIQEPFWPEIARFVLFGTPPDRPPADRKGGVHWLFNCAPVFTALGVALALALLTLPLTAAALAARYVAAHGPSGLAIVGAAGAVAAGLFVSWLVGRFLRAW